MATPFRAGGAASGGKTPRTPSRRRCREHSHRRGQTRQPRRQIGPRIWRHHLPNPEPQWLALTCSQIRRHHPQSLWTLSDPQVKQARIETSRGAFILDLPPPPRYLNWGRSASRYFPTHPVGALAVVLLFVLCLTITGNIVRFFQEYLSDKAAILSVNDLRRKLYDHVLYIPLSFFGLKGTSDVTSRLVQDAQGLQDGFKTVLGQTIQEPIKAAMAFAFALWIDWHLTIFIVLFGPLMFWIIKTFGRKMRRASRKALQSSSSMLGQARRFAYRPARGQSLHRRALRATALHVHHVQIDRRTTAHQPH